MEFDAKKHTEGIIEFIRKYFKENHLGGVVIGISGGKDSGVVAGLFSEALGAENVIGVTMPCHSKAVDASDAKLVALKYGFPLINMDLTSVYDSFEEQEKGEKSRHLHRNAKGRAALPARAYAKRKGTEKGRKCGL